MKNKKSKNIGTKIIFVLSCTVFIICVILVIKMYTSGSSNREEFSATTKVATVETKQDASETTTLPDNPIDFKKLKKTNKDIYAGLMFRERKLIMLLFNLLERKMTCFILSTIFTAIMNLVVQFLVKDRTLRILVTR